MDRTIPIEQEPMSAETPREALDAPLTPVASVFVRNHFDVPVVDPARWRLEVGGRVDAAATWDLAALRRLPSETRTLAFECAGNGRARLEPATPGVPWGLGAVSAVEFRGVPLFELLRQARPQAGAVEVLFEGADAGEVEPGRVEAFRRSLPLSLAFDREVLLAWEMNGAPLTPAHGAPLRLVVPGWYGMASVKWLTRIALLDRPFDGFFQRDRYVLRGEEGAPGEAPVTRVRVRSLILEPRADAALPPGPVTVRGIAWSGHGPIRAVEVDDGTGRRISAHVDQPAGPLSMARWSCVWQPPGAGDFTLTARATDAGGETQPLAPVWNALGYANNGAEPVRVQVRGAAARAGQEAQP